MQNDSQKKIIDSLRAAEVSGAVIREAFRRHNIMKKTFSRGRNKYGNMMVSEPCKLKGLESENARLKKIVAEQMLAIEGLKEIVEKNSNSDSQSPST